MILLSCFVLVSALVSFGTSYSASADEPVAHEKTLVASIANPATAKFLINDAGKLDMQDDDCPCKKQSGATKFVCGVTLAFSNNATMLHSPSTSKTRYAISKPTTLQSFVDLLKRPPRTIL